MAERELHSVRMRRAAMRRHSSWARDSANLPHVSIVMATKRPWILPSALAAVARQSYPRTELVLALHGNDHALPAVKERVGRLPLPARVVGGSRHRAPGQGTSGRFGGGRGHAADQDGRRRHLWRRPLVGPGPGPPVLAGPAGRQGAPVRVSGRVRPDPHQPRRTRRVLPRLPVRRHAADRSTRPAGRGAAGATCRGRKTWHWRKT